MTADYWIYLRQSFRQRGDSDVSPETQLRAALEAIRQARNGQAFTHEVFDDCPRDGGKRSGGSIRAKLEAIRNATLAGDGPAVGVVAYDLDRLWRDTKEGLIFIDQLEGRGCAVVIATLPHLASMPPAERRSMLINMLNQGEYYRRKASDRSKEMHATRRAGGIHAGPPLFGYAAARDAAGEIVRPYRWEIVERDAEAVRRLFQLRLAGRTYQAIARQLLADGHEFRGRAFTAWDVREVLIRREVYCGRAMTGPRGQGANLPGKQPPIISRQTADAAEVITARRRLHRPQDRRTYTYALKGVLTCCDRPMYGHGMPGGSKTTALRCYVCGRIVFERASVLEAVIGALGAMRTPPTVRAQARDELVRLVSDVAPPAVERRREQLRGEMQRLSYQHQRGRLTDEEYDARYDALEREASTLPLPDERPNVIRYDVAGQRFDDLIGRLREELEDREAVNQVLMALELTVPLGADGPELAAASVGPAFRPFLAGCGMVGREGIEPPQSKDG